MASAVAAAMRVIVKNNRKKMPIKIATNIILSFKPKTYFLKIMEERAPSSMLTWGRVFANPPS